MAVACALRSQWRRFDIEPNEIPNHVGSVIYSHRDTSITARLIPPPGKNSALTG